MSSGFSNQPLFVGRPNVGAPDRILEQLGAVLDSKWLSNNGPFVERFESILSEFLGVDHCVLVCNATAGLELAMRGLGLRGEVVLPSFTFVATAHAVLNCGLEPRFADIDDDSLCISVESAKRCLSERSCAIAGVHVYGLPCNVPALTALSESQGIPLLFDAAHAFGCSLSGRMIGQFGACEVFSFHATKVLNSVEGGLISTSDARLAEKLRLMRNFGFSGYDQVVSVGTNAKMNELCAAVGLVNFEELGGVIDLNRRLYQRYRQELGDVPGLSFVHFDDSERCNYHYVILRVNEAQFGKSRDALVDALWAKNVRARRYFYPGCHRHEPYATMFPDAWRSLPVTEQVTSEVMALPTGTQMDEDDVVLVCRMIREFGGY